MVKRLNSHYSPPLVRSCPVVASGYVDNPSSTADAPPGSSYMPKRQPSSWNTTSSWLRESPGKPCEIFRQLNFRLNCWHLGILCEILVFFHVFSPAIVCNTGVLSDGIWFGGSEGVLKRNMELGNPSCSTDIERIFPLMSRCSYFHLPIPLFFDLLQVGSFLNELVASVVSLVPVNWMMKPIQWPTPKGWFVL